MTSNAAFAEQPGSMQVKSKAGSFQSLNLHRDLLNALNRMGYKTPTPVQRKTLPVALAGMDIVCMARTGSGKTCAFLLPLLQQIQTHSSTDGVRGLILSPTRELANQTYKFAKDMAKFTDLRIANIVGGDPIEAQFDALASRPDIIVATPGRLMHHLREISTFKLKSVKQIVFDEADRLFEMGFAEQLNEIVRECPKERQTLLFSATMPQMLVQFSRAGLRDPQLIRLDTDVKLSDELRLAFFVLRSNEKLAALLYLAKRIIPTDQLTIVFTATRHHSELVHAFLQRVGISSAVVYGTMDQDTRSSNLKAFRKGEVSYLIVTDLAARGIDVPLLNNVINYHCPPSPKLFVHRCGRAARQGRIGFAFTLADPEEVAFMADIHTFLGREIDCCDGAASSFSTSSLSLSPTEKEDAAAALTAAIAEHSSAGAGAAGVSPYTLQTMSPDVAHTGIFPQDVLDEENDYIKRIVTEEDHFKDLWRISENGMKQYKRTRTEASRGGVKASKSLVKGNRIRALHPLIVGCDPKRCSQEVVDKAEFVRALQRFRPSQTVLETGIGTGSSSAQSTSFSSASAATRLGGAKGGSARFGGAAAAGGGVGGNVGVDVMKAFRAVTANALERNKASLAGKSFAEAVMYPTTAEVAAAVATGSIRGSNSNGGGGDSSPSRTAESDQREEEDSEGEGDGDKEVDIFNDEYFDDTLLSSSSSHKNNNNSKTTTRKRGRDVGEENSNTAPIAGSGGGLRLSITERKKLKKRGLSSEQIHQYALEKAGLAGGTSSKATAIGTAGAAANTHNLSHTHANAVTGLRTEIRVDGNGDSVAGGRRRDAGVGEEGFSATADEAGAGSGGSFKDSRFYMTYGYEDEQKNFTEDLMQPLSNLKSSESKGAMEMERAYQTLDPEDAVQQNKKRRVMRWDPKKRKFVRQSIEEIASLTGKNKGARSESGGASKSSKPQGEMYAKWKKRTHREIGGSGFGSAGSRDFDPASSYGDNDYDDRPRPNIPVPNKGVRSELRSADQIRKMKRSKEEEQLKNMPKEKRRKIEAKQRKGGEGGAGRGKKAKGEMGSKAKLRLNAQARNSRSRIVVR